MSQEITVWRFRDAPEHLRALSNNGGDEDWLALLPKGLNSESILWEVSWLESNQFAPCGPPQVTEYKGQVVVIGSHS